MPETRIQKTKNELVRICIVAVVVFSGIMGFITLFALFLAHLKVT